MAIRALLLMLQDLDLQSPFDVCTILGAIIGAG